MARLRSEVGSGKRGVVEEFWEEIDRTGTPLIEQSEDGGDYLVTFVWCGDGGLRNVVVLGALSGWDFERNRLHHIPGTDVWYGTYRARPGLRCTYWFSPNDTLTPPWEAEDWEERTASWWHDPMNDKTYVDLLYGDDGSVKEQILSVLEMPEAPPQPWVKRNPEAPAGSVTEHIVRSEILGNERRVWVYLPPGYEDSAEECCLLLIFDGHSYAHQIPAPAILDNLLAAGKIPPMVAVMPDNLGSTRELELPCYPPFVDFLTRELLPWARDRYRVTEDPTRSIVAGASFGGLAAAFAALVRPDVFGNVLSQSGSFWWKPQEDDEHEWLARRFAEEPLLPLRFYLDVGLMETDPAPGNLTQLIANRHLRNVLRAKGYPIGYAEFDGGHESICWQGTLADGLICLAEFRADIR
jgi:enterochelin esterase-like enzyme